MFDDDILSPAHVRRQKAKLQADNTEVAQAAAGGGKFSVLK
jgi:hypothetical protein